MTDSHLHIGQYNNIYTSPDNLKKFLDCVGVDSFAVSSTTTCTKDYVKVMSEIKEIKELCGDRAIPVLWILPQMFKNIDKSLGILMDSGITWRCLKIHPQLHPDLWSKDNSPEMKWLIRISRTLQCPILIHSGQMPGCDPSLFTNVFKKNWDRIFIIAHGRPLSETINIMKNCDNVWVDTAFMSTEDIVALCKERLVDRILWGTDYPIPKYFYPNCNMIDYYLNLVMELKKRTSESDFTKITQTNFERLFSKI